MGQCRYSNGGEQGGGVGVQGKIYKIEGAGGCQYSCSTGQGVANKGSQAWLEQTHLAEHLVEPKHLRGCSIVLVGGDGLLGFSQMEILPQHAYNHRWL